MLKYSGSYWITHDGDYSVTDFVLFKHDLGALEKYVADIQSANMYYPYGSLQPGRVSTTANGYDYGFQGKKRMMRLKEMGIAII